MNWTTKAFTDKDGRTVPSQELELPGWTVLVWELEHGKFVLGATSWSEWASPPKRHFDTIEEAQAAAVSWLQQVVLRRFTELVRTLGGRVVDVEVEEALLVYDDGLCPECNDGKSRINWNEPSDPVNDLYSCGLHEFHPNDLEVLATEKQFSPGRILLVHFPENEEEQNRE